MSESGTLRTAWAPLARPTFRRLWLAQLGSNIGVWMQTVGAQWYLVEETGDSALVAWVQTASLLPTLLLSLFAGVLADSFDRKRLIIWTTALSTVVAGALTVFTLMGLLNPWLLLLMTFLIGCSSALTAPAWQAIQPELVPREEIKDAAALGSVTINAARAIGPALAGFLVALTGPALVFGLNAVSFLAVIWALLVWRRPAQVGVDDREPMAAALRAGVRYVWSGPIVRRILARSAVFAFPASALWALLPSVLEEELGVQATGYGVALGVLGAGALLGVAVMPALRARIPANALLAASAILFAAGSVAPVFLPFWAVLIVLLLAGIAWIATLTTLNAGLQLSLAQWVRARGMSVYLLVFSGVQAVGSFLWGALSSAIGTSMTLVVAAGLLVLAAASVAILPLRAQTGELDRTIVHCAPEPQLVFDPAPLDGPVTVVVTYVVPKQDVTRFRDAMRPVEKSRRRTGATRWRLARSGEHPDQVIEEFTVPSWGEYRKQATDRWTRSDQDALEEALSFTGGGSTETHFFVIR